MRIAFLGLGLIGGSVARALRAGAPETTIVAWSPSGRGPARARAEGVADEAAATIEEAVAGAAIVVLAGPPLACVDLLRRLAGPRRSALGAETTITDVVSTKLELQAIADTAGLPFVGGHPMAGRETTGFESSDADLFRGRPWVVIPARNARAEDIGRVEWLARTSGAIPVRMTAVDHDRAVAAISHLPLVLAAALVEAVVGEGTGPARPDWPAAKALAAGGWRDMTRLARGDVDMGAGIAATNAGPLAERLRDVQRVLDGWIADLDAASRTPDGEASATGDGEPSAAVAGEPSAAAGVLAARLRNARNRLEDA